MDEIAHDRLNNVVTTYFIAAGFQDGFTEEELFYLTKAMVETGTQLHFKGIVADKHSIGGLPGTRATMILVPIVAAAGFIIPKTSSRAITTPAGTADVMELFAPVNLTPEQIKKTVEEVGGCIAWGGHLGIAPADEIIINIEKEISFQFFDKIVMSIMAKKIAVGANHLTIDIPVGKTMKVQTKKQAEMIAEKFVHVGKRFDMKINVAINHTFEPAGRGIGVFQEALDVLRVLKQTDDRPIELEKRSLSLAEALLDLCFKSSHQTKKSNEVAKELLVSGKALQKFQEIVTAQGGRNIDRFMSFKPKAYKRTISARHGGVITEVNNLNVSAIAHILGAPKKRFAGMYLHKKRNEKVEKGEALLDIYAPNKYDLDEAEETMNMFPIFHIEKK